VADIRTAFGRGDTAAMAAAVTPDMLDAIAVFGTTSEGRERLAARRALPDLAFLAPPSFLVSERRRARYGQAIVAMMRR